MSKKDFDLKNAQADGRLSTMELSPAHKEPIPYDAPVQKEIIDNPEELDRAIGHAKMDNEDHLLISDRLFSWIMKNQKGDSVMYKGIELFKPGVREEILKQRSMKAEEHADYMARKGMQS